MSSYGEYAYELAQREAERLHREQERLRQERLREQVKAVQESIRKIEVDLSQQGLTQVVSAELSHVHNELADMPSLFETDVDDAFERVNMASATISSLVTIAQVRHQEKQMELDMILIKLNALLIEAKNVQNEAGKTPYTNDVQNIIQRIESAINDQKITRQSTINIDETKSLLKQLKNNISESKIKEATRKHIIISLKKTMEEMGFIVAKPKMLREVDQVVLYGKMPSGKRVSFRVGTTGSMEFDLAGYQARECGKDLDKVLNILHEKFSIKCSPPQHNWKNPDKISKGSKDLPIGGMSKTMSGGA